MQSNYLDWVKKAEEDYLVIKAIIKSDYNPVSGILFHAQQCAEKYLKAYLSFKGKEIAKIHDLVSLHQFCFEIDSTFSIIKNDLIYLDGFAVAPRYPDEFAEYEISDAITAIECCNRSREICRRLLNLKINS